jgi:hypothetical protein
VAYVADGRVKNPVVFEVVTVPPVPSTVDTPLYPLLTTPDAMPNWTMTGDVPFVLTSQNTIVIRLTQEGMLVKSATVPEVVPIRVPKVSALAPITRPEPSVLLVSV